MICKKCGTENEEGAKFCASCGSALDNSDTEAAVGAAGGDAPGAANGGQGTPDANAPRGTDGGVQTLERQAEQQGAAPNFGGYAAQPAKPAKKLSRNAIIGIAAGGVTLIVLLIVIIAVAAGGSTIDLNDYLTVEASGYDGYGNVTARVDWDAISEKYGDKISFTGDVKDKLGFVSGLVSPMDVLRQSVSVSLDKSSGLKNGDTVAYTWNVDESVSDYIKCKLKHKDDTYEVSGLETVGTFDAFADLEVTFEGVSPNGYLKYNYTGSQLSTYNFSCDKSSGLRNGDTVVISIDGSNMESYAQNLGMIPESIQKEYTVSGLDEYVEKYEKVTEDLLATLKSEAEDSIYSYTASNYSSSSSLSGLAYAGYIFESVKDATSYYDYANKLYIIYAGTVSSSANNFRATKVYFPVEFTNILSNDEGMSYEKCNGIRGSSYIENSYYTNGYTNPVVCYSDLVTSSRDNYTAECGDGFEVYEETKQIAAMSDITEDCKKELLADSKDIVESYIASDAYDDYTVSGLKEVGEYLLLAKSQGTDFASNNKYYIVYSATVASNNDRFDSTTVYFPVEYDGIVNLPDDDYLVTVSVGIVANSNFPDSYYGTKGYVDGKEMYSKIVSANRDKYTYEMSEGLKSFGS